MRYHRLQITFCLTWWFRQCVGWSHSSRHAPRRPWTARNTLSDSVRHRHHSRSASACWETASYTQGHRCRQEQAHLKTPHNMHDASTCTLHVHLPHRPVLIRASCSSYLRCSSSRQPCPRSDTGFRLCAPADSTCCRRSSQWCPFHL